MTVKAYQVYNLKPGDNFYNADVNITSSGIFNWVTTSTQDF